MDDLINRLRRYGRVEVDEHLIEYGGEWHRIKKGDRYLGQHGDQSPELLTCRRREVQRRSSGRTLGKFFPKERKDSTGGAPRLYTLEEVIRVVIRDNPNYDPTKKEAPSERTVPELQDPTPNPTDGGTPDAGRSGGDRSAQGAGEDGVGDTRPAPKPAVPKPGPRGAEHRDPRKPAGRTDYTAAARKSDD